MTRIKAIYNRKATADNLSVAHFRKVGTAEQIKRERDTLKNYGGACNIAELADQGRPHKQGVRIKCVEGITLHELVKTRTHSCFESPKEIIGNNLAILLSIAGSLVHLHSGIATADLEGYPRPRAHGDIGPRNAIFNYKTQETTLIDFERSFYVDNPPDEYKTHRFFTPSTVSPEQFYAQPQFGLQSDVFCLASLGYYLFNNGKHAVNATQSYVDLDLSEKIIMERFKNMPNPNTPSPVLNELIDACWNEVALYRPDAETVRDELFYILSKS